MTLRDCTMFRATVEAQPPFVAHAGALLCLLTVVVAVAWTALTPVDLVVRATGRVRPTDLPTQVFSAVSQHVEGRIVEVRVQEGSPVRKSDILLRFNTDRVDNEIAKKRRELEASQAELDKLKQVEELQQSQLEIARTKSKAELTQANAELKRARQAREADVHRAQIDLETANDQQSRFQKLAPSRAVTAQQMLEATATVHTAEQNLATARLPIDEERVNVLRQAVELVDRDHAVRKAELESRLIAKLGEVDAASKELADLERQAAQAVLRSPIDGVVTKGQFHVGDVLPLGSPVFEIAPQDGYCFEATIASGDMGLVRDEMPARVKFDAYDYQLYGSLVGKVSFISPDTSSNSSSPAGVPSTGASASGTTYRVRVALDGDRVGRDEMSGLVKLGMAGRVEIITDRRTLLSILVQRIRSSISFG
jgi:HlyD family secretion protein